TREASTRPRPTGSPVLAVWGLGQTWAGERLCAAVGDAGEPRERAWACGFGEALTQHIPPPARILGCRTEIPRPEGRQTVRARHRAGRSSTFAHACRCSPEACTSCTPGWGVGVKLSARRNSTPSRT